MLNRLRIALLLLLALTLAACNTAAKPTPSPSPLQPSATPTHRPTPAPSATPDQPRGTLTIWHSWDETYMPATVQIINDFRSQYPDVLFDVLYVPEQDLLARYQAEVASGGGPDLLLGPAEWGPVLFQAGQIQDISPLVDDELLATLNPPALSTARYQNVLIGLPYRLQGVLLFRNKNIVTLNPNTIDDLISLAQTATSGKEIGAVLERSFFYSGSDLEGLGGRWMDENGMPAFNNDKGLAWVELLRNLEQAGPPNFQSDEDLEAFKQGRVGWIIDGSWNMKALADAIGPEHLAIDPWPTHPGGQLSGYVMAENIYLSPRTGSDRQTTVRAFLRHFLSPTSQAYLAEAGMIPAARGVKLADAIQGPIMSQAEAALAGGTPYPLSPNMQLYSETIDVALRSIFKDGVAPQQALATAEQTLLSELARVQPTPTP